MRGIAWRFPSMLALAVGLLMPATAAPSAARPALGGPLAVDLSESHARVSAVSFDGQGTHNPPVVREDSGFSVFSEQVVSVDDITEGRGADSGASQSTAIDVFPDPSAMRAETTGLVNAHWVDADPGDGRDPSAEATTELSITVEVTDAPAAFSLIGSIDASAGSVVVPCSSVSVTSPSGEEWNVASTIDCGGPHSADVGEVGVLQPGTHSLSVVAAARAGNPDGSDGVASAFFDLKLSVGCSIIGTSGVDVITGSGEDDLICGLGGADVLDGAGGDDVIFGGGGADLITGGPDEDAIAGEGGDDSGLFGGPDDDHIDGGEGVNYIEGGTGNDLLGGGSETDSIFGDDAQGCDGALSDAGLDDDEILGGGGQDFLFGCQGLDKISGGGGDDEIDGNTGNDVLGGNAGSDKLHGNDGSDKLTGGTRKDVLAGDGGDDTILAKDGVLDVVRGGPGGADEAKIDEGVDTVTGVEVFL